MALRLSNKLGLRLLQEVSYGFLAPAANTANSQTVRHRRTKHWDPRWKPFRRMKVLKVDLPNFREKPEDLSDEEIRMRLKEQNILPPRPWVERQFFIHSTGGVFEPYVPPEGDGKISPVSKQGAMQSVRFLEKKTRTMMAIRKVRQFEEDFDTPDFCKEALKIYIKMHEMLADRQTEELIDVVTERAYPEVIHNVANKTIRWRYIKDIELPRVVQARCTDVITKENIYAQLTVRFHTQQDYALILRRSVDVMQSEDELMQLTPPEIRDQARNVEINLLPDKSRTVYELTYNRFMEYRQKKNIGSFSENTLAIYDRFGRLLHGSEIIAKDVLEYVVFEKHLANQYGTWRIHAKIIPDWLPAREPSAVTFIKKPEKVTNETKKLSEGTDKDVAQTIPKDLDVPSKEGSKEIRA